MVSSTRLRKLLSHTHKVGSINQPTICCLIRYGTKDERKKHPGFATLQYMEIQQCRSEGKSYRSITSLPV